MPTFGCSVPGVVERRHAMRVPTELAAELHIGGHGYPAVIQNLSRRGARVGCGLEAGVGAEVTLVIWREGRPRTAFVGTLVYRLGDAPGSRPAPLPVVGILFHEPATRDDAALAELVERLRARPAPPSAPRLPLFATTPTRRISGPELLEHPRGQPPAGRASTPVRGRARRPGRPRPAHHARARAQVRAARAPVRGPRRDALSRRGAARRGELVAPRRHPSRDL